MNTVRVNPFKRVSLNNEDRDLALTEKPREKDMGLAREL
jgi:hypothetical protein